jgi:hypothetical protein
LRKKVKQELMIWEHIASAENLALLLTKGFLERFLNRVVLIGYKGKT